MASVTRMSLGESEGKSTHNLGQDKNDTGAAVTSDVKNITNEAASSITEATVKRVRRTDARTYGCEGSGENWRMTWPAGKVVALDSSLQEILNLPYWSPDYQAWEPFLVSYFAEQNKSKYSAVVREFLPQKIMEMRPSAVKETSIVREVDKLYAKGTAECFAGYSWREFKETFGSLRYVLGIADRMFKLFQDPFRAFYCLSKLLDLKEGEKYSESLAYAVVLYRNCEFVRPLCSAYFLDRFQAQLDAYADAFSAAFDLVFRFVGTDTEISKWYCNKVKASIVNAWRTALDLSEERATLKNTTVFNMEVWLSEQLSDYLQSLPCVSKLSVDTEFVWAVLDNVMLTEGSKEAVFAFCLNTEGFERARNKLDRLNSDLASGNLVQLLLHHANTDSIAYLQDLEQRGFPVEELNAGRLDTLFC